MNILGERLRTRRKALRVTQQWVADRIAVDHTTYTKYENGQAEPSLECLCRLSDVLRCPVQWLLGRE